MFLVLIIGLIYAEKCIVMTPQQTVACGTTKIKGMLGLGPKTLEFTWKLEEDLIESVIGMFKNWCAYCDDTNILNKLHLLEKDHKYEVTYKKNKMKVGDLTTKKRIVLDYVQKKCFDCIIETFE